MVRVPARRGVTKLKASKQASEETLLTELSAKKLHGKKARRRFLAKCASGSQPEFLNRRETADIMRVGFTSLRNYEEQNILHPVRRGRKVLYRSDEVYREALRDMPSRPSQLRKNWGAGIELYGDPDWVLQLLVAEEDALIAAAEWDVSASHPPHIRQSQYTEWLSREPTLRNVYSDAEQVQYRAYVEALAKSPDPGVREAALATLDKMLD